MKDKYPHLYEFEQLGIKTREGKDYLANNYTLIVYEIGLRRVFLSYRVEKCGDNKEIHQIEKDER